MANDGKHAYCKELNFAPFQYNDNRCLLNNKIIDPDNNFYNSLQLSCKYVTENEFKTLTTEKQRNLSIFHLNARSVKENYDGITNYLKLLEFDFDIIAVSESWININEHYLFPIDK